MTPDCIEPSDARRAAHSASRHQSDRTRDPQSGDQRARYAGRRETAQGPWFTGLGAAKDIHARREVARAVAQWADGDSVAAHYAYGNDIFCTLDGGKAETRRGEPAVLDANLKSNRR